MIYIYIFVYTTQSYRTSHTIWDRTVLPATRHKWMCPA